MLREEDAAALHRLVNDWEVAKTLARVPFPYPRELADEWIVSTWAQIAAGEAWHLAMAGADDALLGCAGLTLNRRTGRAELGYWVGRRHWGKGLGPEAAGRLARWALDELGVEAVDASVLRDNARSVAMLRRLGIPRCGRGDGALPVARRGADAGAAVRSRPGGSARRRHRRRGRAGTGRRRRTAATSSCWWWPAPWWTGTGACCWPAARKASRWPGSGSSPAARSIPSETPEAALIRELGEELGIGVEASCLAPFTFASHPHPEGHLLMPLFLCRKWEGAVRAREGQALAWVRPQRLRDYAMPPADKPLVAMLRDFL